jgi:hypothetical protein
MKLETATLWLHCAAAGLELLYWSSWACCSGRCSTDNPACLAGAALTRGEGAPSIDTTISRPPRFGGFARLTVTSWMIAS